jgi:hypothetical protein
LAVSLNFSQGVYYNDGYARIYFVALGRCPRHSVNYAYVALPSRASYLQASPPFRYDPCEKFGLGGINPKWLFNPGRRL